MLDDVISTLALFLGICALVYFFEALPVMFIGNVLSQILN